MTLSLSRHAAALAGGVLLAIGTLTACGVEDTAPVAAHPPADTPAESGTAVQARAGVTYLLDCIDEPVAEPSSYTVACADGNQSLVDLRWSDWGAQRASATGAVIANDCDPSCAEGSDVRAEVRVVASDLVDGEAAATYGRLTITVTGDLPPGMARRQVIDLRTVDPVDPELTPGS